MQIFAQFFLCFNTQKPDVKENTGVEKEKKYCLLLEKTV
jgi:hypothetical protein